MFKYSFMNIFLVLVLSLAIHSAAADPSNLRRSVAADPPSGIVPILECIDKNNKAYFSYQYDGGAPVNLALSDQNRLTPLNIAPITDFVNGSGPAFPFSQQVSLVGYENSTFNWDLSNYFLTFNITPERACPKVFNITFKFNYEVEGSLGFLRLDQIISKFAQVAGISVARVEILDWTDTGPTSKRGLFALETADLTLEIALADGNSSMNATEPTAAEVIDQFITEQKTEELNQQLQSQFSPKYSNLTEFTPKSDATPSIYGQARPPTSVPVAEPVVPMADNAPTKVPLSSPKPKTTLSTAILFSSNLTLLSSAIIFVLVKIGQM